MKRNFFQPFISILLITVMLMSLCVTTIAEENGDSEETLMQTEQLGFLSSMGIITPYDDGTYNLFADITRAELAVLAVRMLGMSEATLTRNTYFTDVPNYHWAAFAVEELLKRGIISPADTYRPDEPATMMEVCKVMVSLCGYQVVAEVNGGYPMGYLSAANRADIMIDVSENFLDSPCPRSDAFVMAYNALITGLLEQTTYGNSSPNYSTGDATMLSVYHKIYRDEGRVDVAGGISLIGDDISDENHIFINGEAFQKGNIINEDEFLGHEAAYYYRETKTDKELVFLYNLDESVLISGENLIDFSDYELQYYDENENSRRAALNKSVVVIKNGKLISEDISKAFAIKHGTIELIGAGGYDVAIIREVETILCSSIDYTEEVIYGTNKDTPVNVSNDVDIVRLYQDGGLPISLSEIKRGQLLSVVRSEEYVDVCVSTRSEEITIDSITQESDYVILSDGEESYKVIQEVYNREKAAIKPGRSVKLQFNVLGLIGDIKVATEDAVSWGYLYQLGKQDEAFTTTLKAKLYTSAGELQEFTFDKNIRVDEKKYDMAKTSDVNTLKNRFEDPQIIVYKADENNVITKIDSRYLDSSVGESQNSLKEGLSWGSHSFVPWTLFLPLNFVEEDTLVLEIPDFAELPEASVEDFTLSPIKTAITWQWMKSYDCATYRFDGEGIVEDIVVLSKSGNIHLNMGNADNNMFVVSGIRKVLDKDENVAYAIRGVDRTGVEVTYTLKEGFMPVDKRSEVQNRAIERGDTILADFVTPEEISNIEILYDASEKKWIGVTDGTNRRGSISANQSVILGYVSKFYGDYVTWAFAPGGAEEGGGKIENFKILRVDNRDGEIRITSENAAALRDYEGSGDACSKILAQAENGKAHTIIIYEEN
ncbi:MAG: S-layer homology domain-containing protein [Clostridia bacterium]|nr:S-layer homology domain-containing protein [Clostridia bacterium]